jgi:two-component system, NtrC family, sensor histidine kinase HydH
MGMHPGPEQPITKAGSVAMSVDGHPRIDADEHELARLGTLLALGKLAPSVIHEINNPLFAILGLLEFLLAEAEPGSKAEQRLLLMQQSGLEIKGIVRTILDFSRERSEERVEVDLGELAQETVELFCRTSVARDVESRVEAGPGPLTVVASRQGLKVALLVLLSNAEQALSGGGAIVVEVANEGDRVVARVTDTGEGVAEQIATQLFEPFFTTRAQHGAAGLGLAIGRATARAHGGDLILERATPGATFALSLPAA